MERVSAARELTAVLFLTQMSEDDIKKLQSTGGDHLAATEKNILSNDLPAVWDLLSQKKKGGRIDIVMDNAGFELFCDMIYADFLIVSGLASEVRFHGKVSAAANTTFFVRLLIPTSPRSASHGSFRMSPLPTFPGSSIR